nr:MAG TPA: hypothetical protein [Caudoviricetes sp.]
MAGQPIDTCAKQNNAQNRATSKQKQSHNRLHYK